MVSQRVEGSYGPVDRLTLVIRFSGGRGRKIREKGKVGWKERTKLY